MQIYFPTKINQNPSANIIQSGVEAEDDLTRSL